MTTKQIIDLPIQAGVYTEQTERGAVGQWRFADKVRFRKNLPEKIGGWVRLEPQFLGRVRRLRDWSSLDNKKWAAIGTESKLYVWQSDGSLFDITPLRDSGTLTNPFDTVISTSIVTVNHVNHGSQAGDYVRFENATAVGGITVDGEYSIASIVNQDSYTIVDSETATSSVTGGGGTVDYEYDISIGASDATAATGYGTGGYGAEGYGNARSQSTLVLGIRTWTLDNWGEDLLACPRGGAIYWWDRSKGTGTRAKALGEDAPPINEGVIISQRDRHVIALGAYDYFNERIDPLLIRWCSTEDLNDWIPTSTNTAGDLRLYSGSKIVAGVRSRLELLVFTDVSVHTLPFVGGFDVFGLNIVGENVSILGPNCAVAVDSRVFFMAEADFYYYDGVVRVLPCDVRNLVYDHLNVDQKDKIYAGLNREFNEVWWFYPSYDPNTWVQDTFELGLPADYSIADASSDTSFSDVLFQADLEGSNGSTTYTEESQYAESGTFSTGGTGVAEIRTASPIFDTSSAYFDTTGGFAAINFAIQAGNVTDWNTNAGRVLTAEIGFRFDTLPVSDGDAEIFTVGFVDQYYLRIALVKSGSSFYFRADWGQATLINVTGSISAGVDYFMILEGDYRAGVGVGTERVWFGPKSGGTIPLLDTFTNQDPSQFSSGDITIGGGTALDHVLIVDHIRVTNSAGGRYTDATSTATIPDPYSTGAAAGDAGYVYNFNSGGYIERVPTADNGYEHDFFLTNPDPILTPTESEYAIEIDVNPDIGANTGSAGLSFLRTNVTGTPNTDADDCNQWMVELDYDGQLVRILKKEGAAPTNPDNLVSNTVDFTTLTGSAMVTDQRYVISAQFDTPQITVWVDGNQAFQFDMSAAELALFTSGTAGAHASPTTTGDQYRFYNFATGPIGTITAADFDISPVEVNRYVAYNYEENTWTPGKMARTAWADRSPLLEKPYAAGTDGYLYKHETGTDDNGAAMLAYAQSFDMELPEAGEYLMHVDQLIPDFLELEGTVELTLSGLKYPQDPNRIVKGPYPVTTGVRKISTRIRARQVALRVESNTKGDKWRMGTIRGRVGQHGKRG